MTNVDDAFAGLDGGEQSPENSHQKTEYASLAEFVEDFLLEMCWRDTSAASAIWCPEWWRHPAAILRLDALWRSFEALRLDPALGMSTWLLQHADPHMAVLTDPQGPFKGCNKEHISRSRKIPTDRAPRDIFLADE
ncbi:DUF4913 domain-containing protein [Aeromicrobium camelliae]|uniref:DUF4913 domain-containing protein n=1 Tax=Aeromicrobium camelliae TaxID=1538144 RepID=A0A3N6WAC8_9ACTN|nr:DUF4913 domain-containing protein [Aeromicrobium camelliae]RQN02012.1 DUF4913 domain-containing protein [Aeromicrobium camelliae]